MRPMKYIISFIVIFAFSIVSIGMITSSTSYKQKTPSVLYAEVSIEEVETSQVSDHSEDPYLCHIKNPYLVILSATYISSIFKFDNILMFKPIKPPSFS
jgi:hypothetical protein